MSYTLHPGAERDIGDAIDFYAARGGPRIARRFLSEVARVIDMLAERPGFGTPISKGRRSFPLRVFPYSVIYSPLGDGILVLVVRHHHRRPSYGAWRK